MTFQDRRVTTIHLVALPQVVSHMVCRQQLHAQGVFPWCFSRQVGKNFARRGFLSQCASRVRCRNFVRRGSFHDVSVSEDALEIPIMLLTSE